ncbi:MAG: YaaL family protein [Firmicutes bacterium]|nr:YaaL family protein [Bacillota bacterium]
MPVKNPHKYLEQFLVWLSPLKQEPPGLAEAVDDAKKAWIQALDFINVIDHSLVDYAVHNISAAERRYMALIEEARREGITAWPELSCGPVMSPNAAQESCGPAMSGDAAPKSDGRANPGQAAKFQRIN